MRINSSSTLGALGSWHDHHQWCLRAHEELDLQPLAGIWAESSERELVQAESELKNLKTLLPPLFKKIRAQAVEPLGAN